MIKLIKISVLLPLQACFSTQKYKPHLPKNGKKDLWLSANAQRAIWATAVIRKISWSKGSDEIMSQSLREQLLNMKHPSQSFSNKQYRQLYLKLRTPEQKQIVFEEQFRKEILSIFSDGAELSVKVFSQERIRQGKDRFRRPDDTYQAKFIFCPNSLVTQPVFDALLKLIQDSLMYGGFGISKTVSLVLFDYLSCIINKYTYDSFKDESLYEEYKFLKQNFLNLKVAKMFYWSLRQEDDFKSLKYIIIQQASQLQFQQKNQILKIQQFQAFVNQVRQKYTQKGIETSAVIDQINVLASKFRQWNFFWNNYLKYKQQWTKKIININQVIQQQNKKDLPSLSSTLKEKYKIKQDIQIQKELWQKKKYVYTQIKEKGQKLKKIMKQFQLIGVINIFNSQINIQKDLLTQQLPNQEYRKMELKTDHAIMPLIQINYFETLVEKRGCNQFSHYFWFQIQKKLKNNSEFRYKDQLDWLKKTFYEEAKNQKWPLYARFVNIANMLINDKYKWFGTNINTKFSKENFRETAKEIIKQLPKSSIEQYRLKIKRFIDKQSYQDVDKDKRIMFLHLILTLAKMQDQKSTQNLKIQIPKLPKGSLKDRAEDYLYQPYSNKQLFAFQYDKQNPTITFLWTPKQFIDIIEPIVYDTTMTAWNIDPSLTQDLLIKNRAVLGHFLEAITIRALSCKDIVISLLGNNYKLKQQSPQIVYELDSSQWSQFQIYRTQTFEQFNSNTNPYTSIHQNFDKIYTLAKENPGKYILGLPIRTKQGSQVASVTSASFDFVIIYYDQKENRYKIFTFDTTVSRNQVYQKLKTFQKKFEPLFSSLIQPSQNANSTKYSYQHIIIGNLIPRTYKRCKLTIRTCLFETVNFTPSSKDLQTQKILQYFHFLKGLDSISKQNQIKKQKSKLNNKQKSSKMPKQDSSVKKQTDAKNNKEN